LPAVRLPFHHSAPGDEGLTPENKTVTYFLLPTENSARDLPPENTISYFICEKEAIGVADSDIALKFLAETDKSRKRSGKNMI